MKFLIFLFSILIFNSFAKEPSSMGVITKSSQLPVEIIKEKTLKVLTKKKFNIMAVIEHDKNAKKVGLELQETTLIIFGNPKVGTILMQNARGIAIDLPQKILIYKDGERTIIQYNDPFFLQKRHRLAMLPQIEKISKALDLITEAIK